MLSPPIRLSCSIQVHDASGFYGPLYRPQEGWVCGGSGGPRSHTANWMWMETNTFKGIRLPEEQPHGAPSPQTRKHVDHMRGGSSGRPFPQPPLAVFQRPCRPCSLTPFPASKTSRAPNQTVKEARERVSRMRADRYEQNLRGACMLSLREKTRRYCLFSSRLEDYVVHRHPMRMEGCWVRVAHISCRWGRSAYELQTRS
ncbi:hypothetical protein K456DRAFT_595164 [Colletotrichum gloeosporioides 23]|nr:hypothetical protein K456DRAFT_595164 [Colletotrichum gloeosporioides 23]